MNLTRPQRIDRQTIKKILLIRLRRIGDIIMTTPAVSALKSGFPNASISYIVEEPYRELVEGNPNLDRILVLKKKQSRKDFLKFARQIRREKYDAVIDFHGGPRASLITCFSKARLKVGYKIKYKNFIYHIKLPRGHQNELIHSVENHINLVRALGVDTETSPPLFLPQAKKTDIEKVKAFISENRLDESKIISLHIGAGNRFRDWGVDNLINLANLLSRQPDVKIVLIGADEDKKVESDLLNKSSAPLLSLVGKLNLRELREIIFLSALFVGPDSGPMHIAATTPTPIVAYFGPTLPAHFAPWKAKTRLIEKDFDCRPCKQKSCIYEDFRCLRSISPEEICEACTYFLNIPKRK
ncbi:glycosyltransferase family 9 protein [Acidobacteriota bacterium]